MGANKGILRSSFLLEKYRYILGDTVLIVYSTSTMAKGDAVPRKIPFTQEILSADGSRLLSLRDNWFKAFKQRGSLINNAKTNDVPTIFEYLLLESLPQTAQLIELSAAGGVFFYESSDDLSPNQRKTHPNFPQSIGELQIDGESKSSVTKFEDGRLVISQKNNRREVLFPDGTNMITNQAGNQLFVSKSSSDNCYPSIEVDLDIDSMCRSHARGIEVPINKGGERVRARIALPDGTAVMVSRYFILIFVFSCLDVCFSLIRLNMTPAWLPPIMVRCFLSLEIKTLS